LKPCDLMALFSPKHDNYVATGERDESFKAKKVNQQLMENNAALLLSLHSARNRLIFGEIC